MTIRKFAAEGTFGCEHDESEMEFVDWMAAFEKDQGRPFRDQGVRQWTDGKRRGRFC